jgi:hypothetical protein
MLAALVYEETRNHFTHLSEPAMEFADTSLNQSVETRPLASLTQRDQIFFTFDKLFLCTGERFHIPKPGAEATVVVV